jgi:hypothetical protein
MTAADRLELAQLVCVCRETVAAAGPQHARAAGALLATASAVVEVLAGRLSETAATLELAALGAIIQRDTPPLPASARISRATAERVRRAVAAMGAA